MGLSQSFYRGSDCCILVFDVTNRKSFECLSKWREDFVFHADPEDPEHFPFLVIGNKVDKAHERQVSTQDATSWCEEHSMPYFEASAFTNQGVTEAFFALARTAIE